MIALSAYLDRINWQGDARPDLETLRRVHRQHLYHIPYETLDIHLGREMHTALEPTFEKLVERKRGGWCYELNGLLAWALEEIGFEVRRVAAGAPGFLPELGNHLMLLVPLEETWLVDVGMGDGLLEPMALRAHATTQGFLDFRLEESASGEWVFHNHRLAGVKQVNFGEKDAEPSIFEARSRWLQTSPESPYFNVVMATRFTEDGIESLYGRIRRKVSAGGKQSYLIDSAEEFAQELEETFGIRDAEVESLWPVVEARHETLFGDKK